MQQPRTCVIISYWVARSTKNLYFLLRQMQTIDAGSPFDVVIVANGGDLKPLVLPPRFDSLKARVFNRENTYYNLGAWDYGWQKVEGYEFFLFIQDECYLKRPGWVEQYEFRMTRDLNIGLLGEQINWSRMSWSFIRESTDRDLGNIVWPVDEPYHPIDTYQMLMEQKGIPKGDEATYLNSIVFFTSRKILEEIGGFPLMGLSYREAIACEVATSRVIASRGYKVTRVTRDDLSVISHRQWTATATLWRQSRDKLREVLYWLGLKRKPRTR
jgi:hypothetical protein